MNIFYSQKLSYSAIFELTDLHETNSEGGFGSVTKNQAGKGHHLEIPNEVSYLGLQGKQ